MQVRDWVRQHAAHLGVDYLIWNEQIWSTKRAGEGWRQCGTAAATCYTGADDSASHRNHVHVSVFGTNSVEYAKTHGGEAAGAGAGGLSARRRLRPRPEEPERLRRGPGVPAAPGHDQLRQWYRSCLALVANAYGWGYSGVGTAGQPPSCSNAQGS